MIENKVEAPEMVVENAEESAVAATKAAAFRTYIEKENIGGVQEHEVGDAVHSHVFRSNLPVQGQSLPFMILIDDSVYTLIQVEKA